MKKKLFFISALLISIFNYGQEAPTKIKVYTPTGTSNSTKSSKDNSYKWVVKTDLLGIVSGEFPLIGEYRIAPKFSIEASAGLTYAYLPNDFLSFNNNDDTASDVENTKAAMGSAFRAAIKFYPSVDYDAIEGWNFGIQLFTKTTNREYDQTGDGAALINGLKDSKTKTGIALIIGKQIFQDSNVTFEGLIGIGLANVKRESSVLSYDNDTNLNLVNTITTSETKPNIQLGCRIGFGN
jgi:hypothetical protein